MKSKANVTSARILVAATVFSLALITYVVHREYASEISEKIEEVVVEHLPDLENSLAKL